MKDKSIFILAALESIELIQSYTDGFVLDDFLGDKKTQDAVIRNLEIIGQALKDFGIDVLAEKIPNIPWYQIAGMRNILAHDYLGVDIVMVWDTTQNHLEVLHRALEKIRKDDF